MRYNVFTDFHHASLLNSFIMLFEKRLDGIVYRPIGMEWAEKGFWKVYDHPATQAQYLSPGSTPHDGTAPLNDVVKESGGLWKPRPDIYWCNDIDSGQTNKAIDLGTFMSLPIDIVIASLPQHIEPFKKLCQMHPNKPKFIYQIGNAWNVPEDGTVKNVMASARVPNVPDGINYISYHQEFDLQIFRPFSKLVVDDQQLTFPGKDIFSFINVFQNFPDYPLFEQIEKMLPDWRFRSYGGQCRDGSADGSEELASRMREARFIWHTKAGGDGYGHVLFNSAAVGRPLITKKSYYSGKLGEKLMIDGVTCINIDNLPVHEIVDKINYYSDPTRYAHMCQLVYTNFREKVDFDQEFAEIKVFLANLQ
jgi:hypothetical protein